MKAIWSIARLDLLLWLRMPFAIVSSLVPPVAMAVFLVVLSLAVTQQPVALVVLGDGQYAKRMADIIRSDNDAYLLTETDESTARRMLSDQEVAAIITIPADFDKKIEFHKKGEVNLCLNNVDTDFADDIRRSVDRSVYRLTLEKNQPPTAEELRWLYTNKDEKSETPADERRESDLNRRRMRGNNPYLIRIDEQDLRKTNVEWLNYQIVPALILLILNVGLVGTALLCAKDLERKTAIHLVLSPQNSICLVTGKLVGGFIACLAALVPALVLCTITGVLSPPLSHWPAVVAIFAATSLFASATGVIIGAVMQGARTIAMTACVVATYLFLLGGGFTTIAFLPEWVRFISSLVPTRYAIDGIRQSLFYSTLDGVTTDLLVLFSTTLGCCILASFFVRRAWAR